MSASLLGALSLRAADANTSRPSPGALLHATLLGDMGAVRKLLDRGASVNQPVDSTTPLMAAAGCSNASLLRVLLDASANVSEIEDDGSTALLIACHVGCSQAVAMLIKAARDQEVTSLIDLSRHDTETPLSCAMRRALQGSRPHLACVLSLLEARANPESAAARPATTPHLVAAAIYAAQKLGRKGGGGDSPGLQLVRALLAAHANPDAASGASRSQRKSALCVAAATGDDATATALLDGGASVDQPMANGATPLICACAGGGRDFSSISAEPQLRVVATLLARRADPALRKANGASALYCACRTRPEASNPPPPPASD